MKYKQAPAWFLLLTSVSFGACTSERTSTDDSTSGTDPESEDTGDDDDSASGASDMATSPECKAYCAKKKAECGATCDPEWDCAIDPGQCAASTRKFMDCQTTTGKWACGGDGFSIFHRCKYDTSLCE